MRYMQTTKGWMFAVAMVLLFAACKPSDEKIAEAVKAKMTALSPAINATVTDGVATLTGEVPDESTKAAAETALQGIKGLKSVVNNLTIPPPPPPPAPVVINPDDVLKTGIDSALAAKGFKDVSASVSGGVVTLTGTAKKADLKAIMQAANELKPKKVLNQLNLK